MRNITKRVSFFLSVILILSVFCSCSEKIETDIDEVKLDTERVGKLDIVPEDVKFEGKTFNILCRNDNSWGVYTYEITSDGQSEDLIDKAIYQRNKDIEDRFDITINTTELPGQWDVKDDFIAQFKDSILSGKGQFDLIMGQQAYMADCNLFELYTNLYDVPYIKDDLDSDYFYQKMVDEITVDGKLYFALGDFSLSCIQNANVMFFNKTLAGDELTEKIYTLVNQGKWTINNVIDMSLGYYRDLNGNGTADINDRYGYVSDIVNTTDAWFSCFDCQATGKAESGSIVLNLDIGKMSDIIFKMNSFFKTNDVFSYYTNSTRKLDDNSEEQIFEKNHSLFFPSTLNHAEKYRELGLNFGIVPLPKWNEAQESYYTQAQNDYSVAVIPKDVKDIKMCGAVLDSLMAESKQAVTSNYLNKIATDGDRHDETTERMLQIILDGMQFNFGYFYYDNLRTGGIIRYLMNNENDYFVSYYSANQRSYEKNLNRILEQYKK